MMAKYDAATPRRCARWSPAAPSSRSSRRTWSRPPTSPSNEVYDEISAQNADFKTIYDSVKAFRGEGYLWCQVAEYSYDTFMIRNRTKG